MQKKILPLDDKPPIMTYIYLAATLGIMSLNFDKLAPWFYSHFIQIFTGSQCGAFGFFDMDFYDYPFLCCERIKNSTLQNMGVDIEEFIKTCIDNQSYVMIKVDEYYLPNMPSYKYKNFLHDVFIYGYDEENSCFDITCYGKSGLYSRDTIMMSDLKKALYIEENGDKDLTYIFKLRDHKAEFDLKLVTESIFDYVYSQNTSERLRPMKKPTRKRTYGIKTCMLLKKRLEEIIELGENSNKYKLDLRTFRLLWEHKKCMYDRLCYMCKNEYVKLDDNILEKYMEVVKSYNILFNMATRLYYSKRFDIISRLVPILDKAIFDEQEVLLQILDILTKNEMLKDKLNLKVC